MLSIDPADPGLEPAIAGTDGLYLAGFDKGGDVEAVADADARAMATQQQLEPVGTDHVIDDEQIVASPEACGGERVVEQRVVGGQDEVEMVLRTERGWASRSPCRKVWTDVRSCRRVEDLPVMNVCRPLVRSAQCQLPAPACWRASRSRRRFSSSSSRPLLTIATVFASSRKCGSIALSVIMFWRRKASAIERAS